MALKDTIMRARTPEDDFNKYSLRPMEPIEKLRFYTQPEPGTLQARLGDLLVNTAFLGADDAMGAMTQGPNLAVTPMIMGKTAGKAVPASEMVGGNQYLADLWRVGGLTPGRSSHWFDKDQVGMTQRVVDSVKEMLYKGMSKPLGLKTQITNPMVWDYKAQALEDALKDRGATWGRYALAIDNTGNWAGSKDASTFIKDAKSLGIPEEVAKAITEHSPSKDEWKHSVSDWFVEQLVRSRGGDAAVFRKGDMPIEVYGQPLVSELMLMPEAVKRGQTYFPNIQQPFSIKIKPTP